MLWFCLGTKEDLGGTDTGMLIVLGEIVVSPGIRIVGVVVPVGIISAVGALRRILTTVVSLIVVSLASGSCVAGTGIFSRDWRRTAAATAEGPNGVSGALAAPGGMGTCLRVDATSSVMGG